MAVTLGDFVRWLEELIPLSFQEDYDNSGLQVGDPSSEVTSVLLTVDVTPEVIAEAADLGCNLVMSHHPLIFKPLKRLAYSGNSEVCVAAALKRGVAVYSAHTSFDNMAGGGFGFETVYAHLDGFNVRVGQKVKRGDVIGFVGSTGLSTAPHLHYEVRVNGNHTDPALYYFNDLTPEEYERMLEISGKSGQTFD